MLKWFKKIKERFFEEDEQYDNEFEFEDEQIEEQDEVEQQQTEKTIRRPSFRFPIISDAEIYGWDEKEEKVEEQRPVMTEEETDFEPIPLYQHERWPKQQEMKVHRANQKPLPIKQTKEKKVPTHTLHEQFEKEVSHNNKKRFEPTKVPSPIFGYKKPNPGINKNDTNESNANNQQIDHQDQSTRTSNEKFMDHVKAITTYPEEQKEIISEQDPLLQQESEKSEVKKETPTNELDMESSDSLVVANQMEDSSIDLPSSPLDEESKEDQVFATNEDEQSVVATVTEEVNNEELEPFTVINTEEIEMVDDDQTNKEEQFVQDNVDQFDGIEEQDVENHLEDSFEEEQVEQLSSATAEEIHKPEVAQAITEEIETPVLTQEVEGEEAVEEESEERIVPFNVLMLKSDKQRLLARQIRDEQLNNNHTTPEEQYIEEQQVERMEQETAESPSEVETESHEETEEVAEVLTEEERLAYYALPSLQYLEEPEEHVDDEEWLTTQSEKLEESLSHFGVQATVIEAVQGPTVTSFELTVGQGTKVSRIRNLTDDLKLALAARDIRIQAPIPGKSSIGIEIPNKKARPVRISEVIQSAPFEQSDSPMEAVLGLGLTGDPVTLDLRKMPHGLIAGATGSGKSVCINSILVSLLYKASPVDLKMMLIDPKMVELAPYNGVPHLISPVITDVKAATAALKWAVQEMERRYELLAHAGVRNIEAFNKQAIEHRQFAQKMPYLLIVIDELADLMMMAPADVEVSISRIAQKARACGIHLIIATQRPSVDVITGIIKANIPTRIAFSVSSQVDSRTMIDTNGAERLLGKGDMLYIGNGESTPIRLQGTFVTDEEIDRIIEHVQNEASPNYLFGQDELLKSAVEEDEDPLFLEACKFILKQNSASTSMLQRNFSIGYNRAAKLMDRLENLSFISPQQGSKARDVYLTEKDLSELQETIL